MMYQCKQCEFSSFNDKALQQHIKEKHTPKPEVPKVVPPIIPAQPIPAQPAQQIEKPNPDKVEKKDFKKEKKPYVEYNFYMDLKGKLVTCEFINGKTISGIFVGFNQWEIKIKTKNGDVIVYKHALATMKAEKVQT
ncbi:MAG: RNA chaperone Hfq [Desulfobacterales bacterium]|nr:RNA chaperone Hfq [Desulfobacterales bacterium]